MAKEVTRIATVRIVGVEIHDDDLSGLASKEEDTKNLVEIIKECTGATDVTVIAMHDTVRNIAESEV